MTYLLLLVCPEQPLPIGLDRVSNTPSSIEHNGSYSPKDANVLFFRPHPDASAPNWAGTDGCCRVRTRLSAGGNRIRTVGPSPKRPALGRVSKKSVEQQLDAKDEAWPTGRQRSQAMLPFTRARNLTSPQRPTVGYLAIRSVERRRPCRCSSPYWTCRPRRFPAPRSSRATARKLPPYRARTRCARRAPNGEYP